MVKKIVVKTQEEFEDMLQKKDIKISKAIVETALANLTSKKRFIPILEIHVQDEGNIFDITLATSFPSSFSKFNLDTASRI